MYLLENIIARMLYAIIPCFIWTLTQYIILCGLCHIKESDICENFLKNVNYHFITNYILIFLCLLFFLKENINLF